MNRFEPVNAIAANGDASMKGTSMSDVGVAGIGKKLGDWLMRGMTEKRVKSSVRPIASGIANMSSESNFGLGGMSRRSGVRV